MTVATTRPDRGDQTVRVLLGTERFSSKHGWSELTALMPGGLQATVDVHGCPPGTFAERARDELIDEGALLDALDEGHLAAAGLDVFMNEPYPASAPLALHPRVIATAHNAALTTSYFRRAAQALGEGLAAHLDGRRPLNALNAPTQPRQIPMGLLPKRHP
jgi:D-isomer specific 2-hydroxyacid dehydrogenase-like protein